MKVAALLTKGGYSREVAPHDFDNLCKAWEAAAGRVVCDPARTLPPANCKGLLLIGGAGTGKTTAAVAITRQGRRYFLGEGREGEFPAGSDADIRDGSWLLDDLGREYIVNDYGVKRELFPAFVQAQYRVRAWRSPPVITTNYSIKELVTRYDAHTVSRLAEMFVVVQLTATDHRKTDFTVFK